MNDAHHPELVGRLRRERRLGPGDGSETRLPFHSVRPDEGPHADDLPFGDEERAAGSRALARHDDAHGHQAQLLHAANLPRRILERVDPVSQPGGILEAQIARQTFQLRPQLRKSVVERLPLDTLQGTRTPAAPACGSSTVPSSVGCEVQTTLSPRRRR